ncbi:MAG: hypothetical protein Q9Q13_01355 [Acidobacteriota bacterium]|nr:hypothetical protein [Acidobacteriota bacterium]
MRVRAMVERTVATFFWDQTRPALEELAGRDGLTLDDRGRFSAPCGLVVVPPLVFPVPRGVTDMQSYLAGLPEAPPLQHVVLLQAGAAALGVFSAGETVVTKSLKKYVVRGRGRAQPLYLRTRGKSRLGSRLRLRNARAMLVEINQRLAGWVNRFGVPGEVFYNAPVRLWSELFAAKVPPPVGDPGAWIKIPLDLPVPTTKVLLATYRRMSYGKILRRV